MKIKKEQLISKSFFIILLKYHNLQIVPDFISVKKHTLLLSIWVITEWLNLSRAILYKLPKLNWTRQKIRFSTAIFKIIKNIQILGILYTLYHRNVARSKDGIWVVYSGTSGYDHLNLRHCWVVTNFSTKNPSRAMTVVSRYIDT